MEIPGLGPKRVKLLYDELGIKNRSDLQKVVSEGKLQKIKGFGPKLEEEIARALTKKSLEEKRFLLSVATQYAEGYIKYLKEQGGVHKVVACGSYRRRKETVGDLDLLCTVKTGKEKATGSAFVHYEEVAEVLSQGETRSSVILRSGIQVDLRIVHPQEFGSALHYFTGSKAHNIAVRQLGVEQGLKINEYGVFHKEERIAGDTEESVFASVGLPWIPPELREDRGEIESAKRGALPKLVELKDIRGDLHTHSTYSDGRSTILEMAESARTRGLEYIAITDHSSRMGITRGVDGKKLRQLCDEIDRLRENNPGIYLLKGIEVEILEDGSLDLPDEVLKGLDLVIGAVHSHFGLSREKQTKRILKAMDHRYFTILAHPTGRLLLERDPYEVDLERIIHHARERGVYLEINAQPSRLDLNDIAIRMAKEAGVLLVVSSDAHSPYDFAKLSFGVDQARRGWLEAKDLINTRPLPELIKLLRKTEL
jgi:DNA polymerase (family 10)